MNNQTANKGEWSELYAVGYLMVNGGGFGANEKAEVNQGLFYKVLKIIDNATGSIETIYKINEKDIEIIQNGIAVVNIDKDSIAPKLLTFFRDLNNQSGSSTFAIQSGTSFMQLIKRDKLSASSSQTADLNLILEDKATGMEAPKRSFSIKSEIGSPATIFNASGSTNIIYKIIGEGEPKLFKSRSPVKKNLSILVNSGFTLQFYKYENSIFENSLKTIDSNLPNYLAELMKNYYLSKTTNLKALTESTFIGENEDSKIKIAKIKKFLSAVSMGLRANQPWSGYPEDFGGLLLVKSDGDVLFYYLYNIKIFEEYLFNNLRFETPSATRHKFGQVFEVDDSYFIKLNLQIRY
jgi:hypothetical protein